MSFSDPNEQGALSPLSPYTGPSTGRRRNGGYLIAGLLLILVLGGGLGFWYWQTHRSVTLAVGPHPTIRATGCVGTMVVQAGPPNQVTFTGDIPPSTQNSATNTIELGDGCGSVTMTVPAVANLDLWASESLTVHGVSGTLKLGTSGGSLIDMEQVTLEGQSRIDGIDTGGTTIDAVGGPIVLNGSLAPGSATTVVDSDDTVKITLSAATSCQLEVSGASQFSSTIPGVQVPANPTNDFQTNIGNSPSSAKLMLEMLDSAIVLHQGS